MNILDTTNTNTTTPNIHAELVNIKGNNKYKQYPLVDYSTFNEDTLSSAKLSIFANITEQKKTVKTTLQVEFNLLNYTSPDYIKRANYNPFQNDLKLTGSFAPNENDCNNINRKHNNRVIESISKRLELPKNVMPNIVKKLITNTRNFIKDADPDNDILKLSGKELLGRVNIANLCPTNLPNQLKSMTIPNTLALSIDLEEVDKDGKVEKFTLITVQIGDDLFLTTSVNYKLQEHAGQVAQSRQSAFRTCLNSKSKERTKLNRTPFFEEDFTYNDREDDLTFI